LELLAVHPQVRWILIWQFRVTLLAGLLSGLLAGWHAAFSATLGGLIAIASGLAYAWRALRRVGADASDARKAYSAQVVGEGYKFAATLLLFTLVFKTYAQIAALPLFLAYVATVFVYWMALLKQR
jgi:ATP synthase protein I